MSLYSAFSTNNTKENKGVPVTFSPNPDGTIPTFYVARQSKRNKKYLKENKKLFEPYKQEFRMKTVKDETAEELLLKGFVKGCLKNWTDVRDQKDKDIPFSEENAYKLFADLPELYDYLLEFSNEMSNYQDESLEADAKN